jgi:hypothetical protein
MSTSACRSASDGRAKAGSLGKILPKLLGDLTLSASASAAGASWAPASPIPKVNGPAAAAADAPMAVPPTRVKKFRLVRPPSRVPPPR